VSAIEAADEDVAKAGAGRHTGVAVTAADGVVGSILEVVVTVGSMSESSESMTTSCMTTEAGRADGGWMPASQVAASRMSESRASTARENGTGRHSTKGSGDLAGGRSVRVMSVEEVDMTADTCGPSVAGTSCVAGVRRYMTGGMGAIEMCVGTYG